MPCLRTIGPILCICAGVAAASGADITFQSGPGRVSLLELFTSEGCSSCPPADAWLSHLVRDRQLWMRIVPVAFHVDYWNRLGWTDPFSTAAHSRRQRAYARLWGSRTVYTPAFVLNGEDWRGWRQEPGRIALPTNTAGRLRVRLEGLQATATYVPADTPAAPPVFHAALLGFGLRTAVTAGENAGRELVHDFVVLDYADMPMTAEGDAYRARLADTLATPRSPTRVALAAWVSDRDGRPLQAAGGWLATATTPPPEGGP